MGVEMSILAVHLNTPLFKRVDYHSRHTLKSGVGDDGVDGIGKLVVEVDGQKGGSCVGTRVDIGRGRDICRVEPPRGFEVFEEWSG